MSGGASRALDRLCDFIVMRRRLVFFGVLASCLVCALGMARIQVENNFRAFVGSGNSALETSDWLSERQGQGRESVILLYRPADRDAFSAISLLQYIELAGKAKRLPHVKSTTSWLDIDKLVEVAGQPGEPPKRRAAPMLFGVDALSPEGLATLRADMLASPVIARRFVGAAGSTAAIIASLDLGEGTLARRAKIDELTAAVASLERDLRRIAPGDSLSLTGSTLFDHAAYAILQADLRKLFPLAFVMVAAVLFAIYRSVPFVALFMLLVSLPIVTTAGLTAALGVEFSSLSMAGLLLVGTLAVADVMHVSNSYFLQLGSGMEKVAALGYALRHNLLAITATTATTIIGEATLFFTSPVPVQMMGVIVISGAVIALFVAVTMLPFALSIVQRPRPDTLQWLSRSMAWLSGRCFRHPLPVAAGFALVLGVCAASIPMSRLDDSMQGWFGEKTRFHQDLALLKSQYLGIDTIVLALEARPEDMLAARRLPEPSPQTQRYRSLAEHLQRTVGPGEWFDLVGTAQARRDRLAADPASSYRPVAEEAAKGLKPFSADTLSRAGLMTRYEPGRYDYTLWYFHSRDVSSFRLTEQAEALKAVMTAEAGGRDVRVGGAGLAIAQVSVANFYSVLWGTGIVFALIIFCMFFVFRSLRIGAMSIVPNLAPLVLSFGIWGYLFGEINMAAVTVLGVAFGIVVDDTIHLLLKYQEKCSHGLAAVEALESSIRECGVGVLATTLILAGGFALLGLSDFLLTAQRAQLAAMTIGAALLFDLMMLPAMLGLQARWARRRLGRQRAAGSAV